MKGITIVNNMLCVDLDENNISFDTTRQDHVVIICKQKHLGLVEQLRKNAESVDFNHIAQSYVDKPQDADDILDMIRTKKIKHISEFQKHLDEHLK